MSEPTERDREAAFLVHPCYPTDGWCNCNPSHPAIMEIAKAIAQARSEGAKAEREAILDNLYSRQPGWGDWADWNDLATWIMARGKEGDGDAPS